MDTVVELKTPEILARSNSGSNESVPRTKESIDPKISLSVVEIDPQSSQFACELTIANTADDDFEVVAARPRLPKGVRLNEAVDATEVQLDQRYAAICTKLGYMITNAILASSMPTLTNEVKRMQETMKQAMSVRNMSDAYLALFFRRVPRMITEARKRQFAIEVTCSADAFEAIGMFATIKTAPEYDLIMYNAGLLASIEREEEFERSRNQSILLKKGQQYKIIYIVNGRRSNLNPTSFSLAVDMVFRRDDYKVSRMEAATITVPPAPMVPTVIAMAAAAIGSFIQTVTADAKAAAAPVFTSYELAFSATAFVSILQAYAVPALTALILYNIFDMTALKNQLAFKRSWRSAILIGFLCGFLNEKILAAVSALLQ